MINSVIRFLMFFCHAVVPKAETLFLVVDLEDQKETHCRQPVKKKELF